MVNTLGMKIEALVYNGRKTPYFIGINKMKTFTYFKGLTNIKYVVCALRLGI